MTDYINHKTKLDDNCYNLCTLIFGQLTENMCSNIEVHEDYHIINTKYNFFLLVASIKGLIFKLGGHNH